MIEELRTACGYLILLVSGFQLNLDHPYSITIFIHRKKKKKFNSREGNMENKDGVEDWEVDRLGKKENEDR